MPFERTSTMDFRAVLDEAPVGEMVLDPGGAIEWANAAAAAILGRNGPDELREAPIDGYVSAGDAERLRDMLSRHFSAPAGPRTGPDPADAEVLALKGPDGNLRFAELTLAPFPGREATRALAYLVGQTHRRVAERRFLQVFENLPLGLLVVDPGQRIVQANAALCEVFGYQPGELVGNAMEILLPARYRRGHATHVAEYSAAPVSRMMGTGRDLTGLHRSGKEFPVEIALTQLDDADRPLFMAIVSDISLRKRAENALQQTNAQLEEFTYVASHDLRNPLRGIGDLIGWIREDLGEEQLPEDVRRNFDRIVLRIDRCEQMIEDLLQYARAGVRDLHMERIDPAALIEEAVAMAMVPETFSVEVEVAGEGFSAPRAPLSTSLRNLIANAVKHHGGGAGSIRITMREEGRFSVFGVEDDGQGIAPGNEERIFKLFHRASPDTTGDGVGLAFTRRMINAHGGMVTVEGHGPLGGARFEIHWPRILLREFGDD